MNTILVCMVIPSDEEADTKTANEMTDFANSKISSDFDKRS